NTPQPLFSSTPPPTPTIYPLSLHDALPISDAERAAEGRADGGADSRDLVLGLERADAEVLVPRELLEDRRGGSDRIRAEKDRQRSEEHTSELQSLRHLVCRLLLEKKK